MNMMVNIGYGSTVMTGRIVSVHAIDSAPIRRMVQMARDGDRAVDATFGKKARSVIVTDTDRMIVTALQADTISERIRYAYGMDMPQPSSFRLPVIRSWTGSNESETQNR